MNTRRLTPPLLLAMTLGLSACDGEAPQAVDSEAVLQIEINGSTSNSLTLPLIPANGTESANVTIRSAGVGDLIVTSIVFERTDDGPAETLQMLELERSLPIRLESRTTTSVELLYHPLPGEVAPTATLTIDSNDIIAGPQTVTVDTQLSEGDIKVDPGNLSWSDVTVMDNQPECGTAPPALKQRFKVINTGRDFLQITEYQLEPPAMERHFKVCPARFEGAGNVIPPSGEREWAVVFHPQSEGRQTAYLNILTSVGKKATVTLRGSSRGSGGVVVSPRVLSWPSLGQDHCGDQNFQICNTGTNVLLVSQIRMRPDGVELFYTISGDLYDRTNRSLRETLRNGDCATLNVLYCAGEDLVEGTIELHHSAAPATPSPIIIELKGQSQLPQLCVDPTSLEFSGTDEEGEATRSLIIQNCGGGVLETKVEEIAQFAAGTFGHENFRFTTNTQLDSIEAGQFEVVNITYTRPNNQVGKDTGTLLLSHNDTLLGEENNPMRIQLLTTHESNNLPPSSCQQCAPSCTVTAGECVTLDCSCSTDEDAGDRDPAIGRCEWRVVRRPAGSEAEVRPIAATFVGANPDDTTTEICLDVPGEYHVELFVRESGQGGLLSPPAPAIEMLAAVPE